MARKSDIVNPLYASRPGLAWSYRMMADVYLPNSGQ